MKKIILSAVVVFAFGISNAQSVKFGVKAGLNLANINSTSTVSGVPDADTSMKVGFHVGGLAEIKLTDKFAIQPELLLSSQGAKYKSKEDFGGGEYFSSEDNLNLTYLNLPVMFKYYFIADKFSVEAGPQIGFLVSAKSKSETTDVYDDGTGLVTEKMSRTVDVKSLYKSIDFGFNVGASYNFTEHIFAGLRYNLGLSDIAQAGTVTFGGETFPAPKSTEEKNNVIQFSFGYKF